MKKSEKQMIMILTAVIVLVAAVLLFFLFKGRSGNDNQEMDTVKEELQQDAADQNSDSSDSADVIVSDSTDTTTETINASDNSDSSTSNTTDPNDVMDADDGYMFPTSGSAYISSSAVKKLTTSQIQYAINEIYARHGLKFTKKENQERFGKKKWYKGSVDDQDNISLNKYEKKNVNTFAAELKKRDAR